MKVRCRCESPGVHRAVHPMREQVGGVIKGPADAKTCKREIGVLYERCGSFFKIIQPSGGEKRNLICGLSLPILKDL